MVEKKNLLIVDNTTTLVSPWKMDLKKYFNCLEVVGGFEAHAKLRNNEISCIIVNVTIQSFNGLDVVVKIREKYKSIPIIVIADKSDLRFVKNAAQFGIHGYFLFPVNAEELFNTVLRLTGVSIAQLHNEMEIEKAQQEMKRMEMEKNKENKVEVDIPKLYYEGQSFLLHENIEKAIEVFEQILNVKKVKDTWRRFWEESIFQLGRCLIKQEKYKEAIDKMNLFMQRAPNSDFYKQAYFLVGECYEKMKNIEKAVSIYKKLINMPPFDSISTQARKRVKTLVEKSSK